MWSKAVFSHAADAAHFLHWLKLNLALSPCVAMRSADVAIYICICGFFWGGDHPSLSGVGLRSAVAISHLALWNSLWYPVRRFRCLLAHSASGPLAAICDCWHENTFLTPVPACGSGSPSNDDWRRTWASGSCRSCIATHGQASL